MSCRLKNVSKLSFKDRICAMSKLTCEAKRESLSFLHLVLATVPAVLILLKFLLVSLP